MQDLRQKVLDNRGGLERLVGKIPGFSGYQAKEKRRDADKLLREHLFRQLQAQKTRLNMAGKALVSAGQLDLMDEHEAAVKKLETLADKIKTATYGYAGFFSALSVKETQLDALYEFDNQLLEGVATLVTMVQGLTAAVKAKEGVADALDKLTQTLDGLLAQWAERQDWLLKL